MASFCRPGQPSRSAWSIEDSARFAALKEYELLRLLAKDKHALAAARRLGGITGRAAQQANVTRKPSTVDRFFPDNEVIQRVVGHSRYEQT